MSREQLGAHTQASDASLAGRQQLIDQRLGEVQTGVRTDIDRLSQLVQQLGDATSERFGQVDRSLQRPRRDHPACSRAPPQPARGVGQLEHSWPMGRADGRRHASPCRLPRGRQLPQAHRGGGRGSGHSRLHVPAAEGPCAVHGRQVPDGCVPQVPRRHHRGRAVGPPGHLRARRARPRSRAGQARVRQRPTTARRSTTCCCSCPTRPQRVHPRERHRRSSTRRCVRTSSSARRSPCSRSSASSARRSTTS